VREVFGFFSVFERERVHRDEILVGTQVEYLWRRRERRRRRKKRERRRGTDENEN
jgi:hypothetical protein